MINLWRHQMKNFDFENFIENKVAVHCVCNEPITSVVEQEPANFCNNCGAEMDEEVEDD